MSAPSQLSGAVALVTGAATGVGRGIALELARAGCRVALNYLEDESTAASAAAEVAALGVEALAVQADVRSSAAVRGMVERVAERFGRLDILVNNAGVQTWAPLLELREEDWDRDLATNLKGCFLCTQAAARQMKETGGGAIINIGSGCNKVAFPRLVSYTASKGGIEMFTKSAAIELAPYGIRVNCVAPGAILVERTAREGGDFAATWSKEAPLGRVGLPRDVGQAVVFLAGPESSFISGQTIWVDGAVFTKPSWPYPL
jgi:NAD(P)-dependent dehydrogenase (short-subunit alcohol dehydrogenase family)